MQPQSAIARNTYLRAEAPARSIGRWRQYEKQLQPTLEELQKQGVAIG